MSLSALNYPPLITTAGLGLTYVLPQFENAIGRCPWSTIRILNLLAYSINFVSVSRPGRLDGTSTAEDGALSPRNGRTLVAPAGWAFAIWGPIFLGEAIGIGSQFLLWESNAANQPLIKLLKESSGSFIAAQLFQSLWCATFRPKYDGKKMYVSFGMLSATAYSLSRVHDLFTSSAVASSYNNLQYGLFFFPMALHFGWTTAASLVNLNGAIAMDKDVSKKVIAIAGHLTVIGASALGVYLAYQRNAPVYSGVIAWALSAVADSMRKRIDAGKIEKEVGKKKRGGKNSKEVAVVGNLYGASVQYILSKTGAVMNAATSFILAGFFLMNRDAKSIPTP